ncbi:MAG: hypothetical protein QNJ73_14790 [Gammaproteobacteria bacterium]|nr:hypothetical protein [Gammaproteobacteria bacterium]
MNRLYLPALLALLISGLALGGAHQGEMDHSTMDHGAMDHSQHDMAGHSTEPDEKGRRLYGMKHNITPAVANELREKIPLFETYSDAELALSMEMMGSNYAWYLSEDSLRGDQGVLLLLHGFKNADENFKQQIESMSSIFPMAMAPGMSMMMSDHIQLALNDIEAAGAKTIVVVPIVSTQFNTMLRQWEYIFGMQDEAPYATVPQVKTNAQILFAPPPGDDPLVAEIMLDHAYEISSDPSNEVVIIAAHGPTFDYDNQKAMDQLMSLAKYMREDGDFADVTGLTLQDDAPKSVRDKNVAKLRGMIEEAQADGKDVLVVTNLIGTRTIQAKLRKDLKGLDYTFNAKGIVAHPNFMKWMGETIRDELERNALAEVAR